MAEELSPEDLQAIIAPQAEDEYADMGLGELALTAARNLPGSVLEAGKGLVQAVASPIETGKAIGQLGYGLGSMAYGAMGGEQDPAAKAENERLARAVVQPYTSIPAFKKELAENPAGPLSMILPGIGGGLVKTGELLGTAGKLGSVASKLGRVTELAGAVVDPARAVMETGRAIGKYGPRAITNLQHVTTGSPEAVFEKAFEAGARRGLDGEAIRDGFNRFYHGEGDVVGLSQDIERAVEQLRDRGSREWIASRGQITGAATQPIDYSGINQSIMDAYNNYGGHPLTRTMAFPEARAALRDANRLVREYQRGAPNTGKNNLAGLDELKRALWDRAQSAPGVAGDAYKKVHAAVRQTLEGVSPEYAALMDEYSHFLDEMQAVRKATGAGPRLDANAQLTRAISSYRTPGGQTMLERVSEIDPTIPYKVAGAALNQNPVGLRQVIAGGSTLGPALAYAITSGDPKQLAMAVPALVGGLAAASPRTMGKANYLAGRGAAAANAVGDIPLGPVDLGDVVSGARKAAYPAGVAAEQIHFANDRLMDDNMLPMGDGSYLDIAEPDATGEGQQMPFMEDAQGNQYDINGRKQRKSGGRIKGNPISAEVRKVRALLSEKTASMLSLPDDAVATALHIAKGK